jgi:hypothetical protein
VEAKEGPKANDEDIEMDEEEKAKADEELEAMDEI